MVGGRLWKVGKGVRVVGGGQVGRTVWKFVAGSERGGTRRWSVWYTRQLTTNAVVGG